MNSTKILLKTFPRHPKGYGQLNAPHTESSFVWEYIQQTIPKGGKYLKHFVESEWIENKNYPVYELRDDRSVPALYRIPDQDIPCGDLNYWLVIYWE